MARYRDAFSLFVIVLVLVSGIGLGRVALSAKAAELSLESGYLRKEVIEQRYAGDMLEIQRSVLTTPSRIEDIACATMNMGEAINVSYIQLDDSQVACAQPSDSVGADEPIAPVESPDAPFLSSVLDLLAGEAKVLLVGDVGLASSR